MAAKRKTNHLKRFNIRVYGLLMNDQEEVLVSDEIIKGKKYTKFPGGGLELGEGTKEGLQREFKEETNLKVTVVKHIYTTDEYVPSAFDNHSQIISIYYLVACKQWQKAKSCNTPFKFTVEGKQETFRWVPLMELEKEKFLKLPLDKKVVEIMTRPMPMDY